LHDGDPAFGQGAAMPLLEGQRLELHDEPQQPHLELFRRPGLRRLDCLIVDGVEGGGLGDSARHSINNPDLVGVQLAAAERLPHGRQAIGEATAACQQAAHRVGLVTQHHRQLVGDELTRPGATVAAGPDAGGGVLGEPGVSVVHRCFCQPSERGRCLPPGIHHCIPSHRSVLMIVPRHESMLAATTDTFRTRER